MNAKENAISLCVVKKKKIVEMIDAIMRILKYFLPSISSSRAKYAMRNPAGIAASNTRIWNIIVCQFLAQARNLFGSGLFQNEWLQLISHCYSL